MSIGKSSYKGPSCVSKRDLITAGMQQTARVLPALENLLMHFEFMESPLCVDRLFLARSAVLGNDGFRISVEGDDFFHRWGLTDASGAYMARRRRKIIGGKLHYYFVDNDSQSHVCEIVIRDGLSPGNQLLTLFHELSHTRFEQFWRTNHRRLARRLPPNISYHERDVATLVLAEFFDAHSEKFAVASERSVLRAVVDMLPSTRAPDTPNDYIEAPSADF